MTWGFTIRGHELGHGRFLPQGLRGEGLPFLHRDVAVLLVVGRTSSYQLNEWQAMGSVSWLAGQAVEGSWSGAVGGETWPHWSSRRLAMACMRSAPAAW
jgi:hypothetical protein